MSGLTKPKQYNWKDTNLALFGSDTEKDIKKASAEMEPAWKNAGTKPGLQIWRIVKFKVTHWPVPDYGKFFDGDSYIILNTYKEEDSDQLLYDVHFWIGKNSSQDEYGTAAYKTVELDILLDDRPIQHREVQGHESKLFKSYFNTVTILRGGAESGFKKVEATKYESRLLHFHGDRKHVEVTEIARCLDMVDSSDVYILDLGLKIYQWNGRNSNKDERFRAAGYVNEIKHQRGKCTSETIDEGTKSCGAFYNRLDEVAESNGNNNVHSTEPLTKKLFRLSDETGQMTFKLEKEGKMTHNDLDTNDVFILDTCNDVFVWIGNDTTNNEKKNAMAYAHNYLMRTQHPLIPITCVGEGKLSQEFNVALTA
ncbi:gelsolin-like protein 2 [Mercenaria mercenaria]|uniref:gelsolin-like protein 2 n=1 Tax=Mercenaria mercenaria TaxID=6596 RepID=UPI00234E539B|nr:gelsolin-like protein 2 [Mercenaria mercenaria]